MEGNNAVGQPAEISFTVEITRAETGKKEVYQMVGHVEQPAKEQDHGDNS